MQVIENSVCASLRVVAGVGVMMCAILNIVTASVAHAESAVAKPVDLRLHPGEVRVLNLDPKEFKEVVPGKVYMRHWFGTNFSVAISRKLPAKGGQSILPHALHSHSTQFSV